MSKHDFTLIRSRFRGGINFAERESFHLAMQCLCHMRSGIGRAQMHGMTTTREHDGDGGSDGGFPHTAFAHGHDDAAALLLDAGDEILQTFHGGSCPAVLIRLDALALELMTQQQAQSVDAKNVDGSQRHDKAVHGTDEFSRLHQGRQPALLHGL